MTDPLHILLVDDEEIVRRSLGDFLSDLGHEIEEAGDGSAALRAIETTDFDILVLDLRIPKVDGLEVLAKLRELRPDLSVIIITGHADLEVTIGAIRLGAVDFLVKPFRLLELEAAVEKGAQVRKLRLDGRRLRQTIGRLQAPLRQEGWPRRLVGVSEAVRTTRVQIAQAVEARCDTVLVSGETGTGKEVVARQLHHQAGPDSSPFIAVSCPALPDSLVESELFGHTRGSFTGADKDRAGYFELADGGTLFLDEVGDLSAAAQAVLLRVLETRAFRRVGGAKEIRVDLRVIAATNASLEELCSRGSFRRDLLYRLNPFQINLLPLRQRREDILPLAEHFLSDSDEARRKGIQGFSSAACELLQRYDYPGNSRELRNVVERAVILCGGPLGRGGKRGPLGRGGKRGLPISSEHLLLAESPPGSRRSRPVSPEAADEERTVLRDALEKAQWNRRKAAAALGMPYSTLRYKIQKLGIR